MQLLAKDSDAPWINNDWHVRGTKCLTVFCGIWSKGAHSPRFELCLIKNENTDHWGWRLEFWVWLFEFTAEVYDQRHWNHYRQKPINTEEDQLEFEADMKKEDETNA